jgi:galactokinase/mevalonate kinase-like predicted kinase
VQRISGNVLKPIRERWIEGDQAVIQGYREIAELARTGKKTLLRGDWEALGGLMNRNHEIQQELGASGKVNDHYIDLARKNGALGAKLAGAGGGGTIIALHHQPDKLIKAFRKEGNPTILTLDPQPGLTVKEIA